MFGGHGFDAPQDNQNQAAQNQGAHAREDPRPLCGKAKEMSKGKGKGKNKGKGAVKGVGKGEQLTGGDRLIMRQVKECYKKKERAAYQASQAMRASLNSLRMACEEADVAMENNVLSILESYPRAEREALEQRQINRVTTCTDENHHLLSATIYDARCASQADHEAYLNDKYATDRAVRQEDTDSEDL